ncbi:MAG: hypothetical protein P1U40_06865 [Coxiellaceae bacterium]|nr:hypothetical protein [Coxiellaceae bacterium]
MTGLERLRLQFAKDISEIARNNAATNPITDALFASIMDNIQIALDTDPAAVTLNANIYIGIAAALNDTAGATYTLNDTQKSHLKYCYQAIKDFKPVTLALAGLFAPAVNLMPTEPLPIAPPLMRMS